MASLPYLFAMKALAARVDRDAGDLLRLYRMCGYTSVDEALAGVERYVPPHLIPARTGFLLRELLPEVD